MMKCRILPAAALLGSACLPMHAMASSHREAPSIAGAPRVDGTDFYMFRSYEPGRSSYVTLIANYIPLEDPYGGPNYFNLDADAVYDINVDTSGGPDSVITLRFRFTNTYSSLAVNAGGKSVPIPLVNDGPVGLQGQNADLQQTYTIEILINGKSTGAMAENVNPSGTKFYKPLDNIGKKSFPDYAGYAGQFVSEAVFPGCQLPGRVFVGQRKEGFVANLGEIFDLVNTNPAGPRDAEPNALSGKNVTSIALELPIKCLVFGDDPVIGAWTTASVKKIDAAQWHESDGYKQMSRLGMPLVNELVIGLPDKDKFNASSPFDDAQFINYVTNPSLPVLLNVLFGPAAQIPAMPRNDLVAAFLTGVKGINQPVKVTPSEMLRLNTSIMPTAPARQSDLGVLGNDLAGFPNGRRPYDDVVDITLRAAEGALCGVSGTCGSQTSDPNKGAPYTDGARAAGVDTADSKVTGAIKVQDTYLTAFPYLETPIPGSPNGTNGIY